ncbi:MAG: HNH endonuclease [Hyphomicrobiales bacterium]|nr:HNH endonuclease [Hyphomicrobiales bacterium]
MSLPDDFVGAVCLLVNKPVEVLIDVADFDSVSPHNWTIRDGRNTRYVVRCEWRENKQIRLHRQILSAPDTALVDHRNRNGLDNRRKNILLCSHSENNCNVPARRNSASGLKGVWEYRPGMWRAVIKMQGRRFHLGCFPTPEQAHAAYKKAAGVFHGEFACR